MTKSACLLIVLICLICLGGCREKLNYNYNYTATMPRLRDRAVVRLYKPVKNDIRNSKKITGSRHIDLQVRCTKATGHKRELTVSLIRKHRKALPWYKVMVNYDTVSIDKRVAVYHTDGKRAKRGERINGWPVPFYFMLNLNRSAFSGKYYIDEEPLADAAGAYIERLESNDKNCRTRVTVFSDKSKLICSTQETQNWIPGEWLWCGAKGNPEYRAIRKLPSGPYKDPAF